MGQRMMQLKLQKRSSLPSIASVFVKKNTGEELPSQIVPTIAPRPTCSLPSDSNEPSDDEESEFEGRDDDLGNDGDGDMAVMRNEGQH